MVSRNQTPNDVLFVSVLSAGTVRDLLLCHFAPYSVSVCFSVFLNMSYQISESERIRASIARYKRRLRNAKLESDPVKRDLLTKICYIKISSARIKLEIRRLRYLP